MTAPVDTEDAPERPAVPASDVMVPATPGASDDAVPGSTDGGTARICPYLTSAGGSWRMAGPSRDHRCGAIEPPAPRTTDKQRRHCLAAEHVDCTIYRAARDARVSTLAAGGDPAATIAADQRRRPVARTAPVLLEPTRLVDQAVRFQFDRAPGQVALIALMVLAFVVVAVTRLSAGGGGPEASILPSPGPVASPSPRPTPTTAPSPTASAPASSAVPSAQVTYKVKKGDTLNSIARTFNTTATKIKALNKLAGNTLKIGQVLKIP